MKCNVVSWLSNNLDKLLHCSICIILAIVIAAIIFKTTAGCTLIVGAGCGFIGAMIAGVAKEAWDMLTGGYPDIKDILADLVGAIIGALLFLLLF